MCVCKHYLTITLQQYLDRTASSFSAPFLLLLILCYKYILSVQIGPKWIKRNLVRNNKYTIQVISLFFTAVKV